MNPHLQFRVWHPETNQWLNAVLSQSGKVIVDHNTHCHVVDHQAVFVLQQLPWTAQSVDTDQEVPLYYGDIVADAYKPDTPMVIVPSAENYSAQFLFPDTPDGTFIIAGPRINFSNRLILHGNLFESPHVITNQALLAKAKHMMQLVCTYTTAP